MLISIQQITLEIVKNILRIARPLGACSSSYGFPSNHSGFAAALLTWLLLEIFFLHKTSPFKGCKHYPYTRNLLFVFIPLVPFSRYFLNYHSIPQILTGFAAGIVISAVIFYFVYKKVVQVEYHQYLTCYVVRFWKIAKFKDNFTLYEIRERKISAAAQDMEEGKAIELSVDVVSKRILKRKVYLATIRRILASAIFCMPKNQKAQVSAKPAQEIPVQTGQEVPSETQKVDSFIEKESGIELVEKTLEQDVSPDISPVADDQKVESVMQQEISCEAS